MNPELLQKLSQQDSLLKEKFGESTSVLDDAPPISLKPEIEPVYATTEEDKSQEVTTMVSEPTPKKKITRSDIENIETELGEGTLTKTIGSTNAFIDELGDETFYVKNISDGHVIISDIEMQRIERGRSRDLLKDAEIEDLKKSRDLRVALSGHGARKLLKRLTPEEYYVEKKKEADNKKAINKIKQNTAYQKDTKTEERGGKIRPTVLSKLEKLSLSEKPATAHLGLTPIEFTEWALSENLSIEELDFIIGSVLYADIRSALLKKKAGMV